MKNDTTLETISAAQSGTISEAAADYWESEEFAGDLAAIEAIDDGQHLVSTQIRRAAKELHALVFSKPKKIGDHECTEQIADVFQNRPGTTYQANMRAIRLCHALLEAAEVELAETVLRHNKWTRDTLADIEEAGILDDCEAVVLAAQTPAI